MIKTISENKAFFILLLFSVLIYFPIINYEIDLHHDLIMLDAATLFLRGLTPYKDYFFQYNILTIFLHAATLKGAFVESLYSLKLITFIFYPLIAFLIFLLSKEITKNSLVSIITSIVWLLMTPFLIREVLGFHIWPTVYMICMVLLGLYALIKFNHSKRIMYLILSSLCFALSFWFKQNGLIYFLLGSVLTLLLTKNWKLFFLYILVGVISSAPFLFYFYSSSSIELWFNTVFSFIIKWIPNENQKASLLSLVVNQFPFKLKPFPQFFWFFFSLFILIQFYNFVCKPFLIKVSYTNMLKQFFSISNEKIIVIFSMLSWFFLYPLADFFHCHMFLSLAFPMLAFAINSIFQEYIANRDVFKIFTVKNLITIFLFFILTIELCYRGYSYIFKTNLRFNLSNINSYSIEKIFSNFVFRSDSKHLINFFYSIDESKGVINLSKEPIVDKNKNILSSYMNYYWNYNNEFFNPGYHLFLSKLISRNEFPIVTNHVRYFDCYEYKQGSNYWSSHSTYHSLLEPNNNSCFIYKEKINSYSDLIKQLKKLNLYNNFDAIHFYWGNFYEIKGRISGYQMSPYFDLFDNEKELPYFINNNFYSFYPSLIDFNKGYFDSFKKITLGFPELFVHQNRPHFLIDDSAKLYLIKILIDDISNYGAIQIHENGKIHTFYIRM
jgi:hypothetical protein